MVGHQKVLNTLKAAIENDNVGHAYIFEGPEGIGRRETALSFAAMLMCQSQNFPCGECKSCQLFEQGSNPDFLEVYTEDKSIGVEDTRELLKGLIIKPLYSKYKVIIINDMDRMTVQAQNALLKSLEEPPYYVVFILTIKSAAAVTPTILSRCQRILFNKLTNEEVFKILETKYGKKNTDWDFIVSYADGIIGTAMDLIDSPDTIQLRTDILAAISAVVSNKNTDLFQIFEVFEKNSDRIEYILSVILLYFRDILIYNMTENFTLLINSDKKDIIIKNADMSYSRLIKCIETVWDTQRSLKNNANFQLSIDVMLMKIKEQSL